MTYTKRYTMRYTMRAEALDAWLKALRSGEYAQTKNKLCHIGENGERSFCCLGVLSDIAVKEGACGWRGRFRHHEVDGEANYLTDSVTAWARLSDQTREQLPISDLIAFTGKEGESVHLSDLNDRGRSFNEIADIIEQIVEPV